MCDTCCSVTSLLCLMLCPPDLPIHVAANDKLPFFMDKYYFIVYIHIVLVSSSASVHGGRVCIFGVVNRTGLNKHGYRLCTPTSFPLSLYPEWDSCLQWHSLDFGVLSQKRSTGIVSRFKQRQKILLSYQQALVRLFVTP